MKNLSQRIVWSFYKSKYFPTMVLFLHFDHHFIVVVVGNWQMFSVPYTAEKVQGTENIFQVRNGMKRIISSIIFQYAF